MQPSSPHIVLPLVAQADEGSAVEAWQPGSHAAATCVPVDVLAVPELRPGMRMSYGDLKVVVAKLAQEQVFKIRTSYVHHDKRGQLCTPDEDNIVPAQTGKLAHGAFTEPTHEG